MPVYADTLYKKPVFGLKKTKTSKVYYGLAGVKKYEPKVKTFYNSNGVLKEEPIDTQKLYFHKFIFFTELMNKTVGKKSARFEDSAAYYLKLLNRNKK